MDDPRDCIVAYNSGCKSIPINKKKRFPEINNLTKPLVIKDNIVKS